MRGYHKIPGLISILHNEVPQAPSYSLSFTEMVLPGEKVPWDLANCSIPVHESNPREGMADCLTSD